MIRYFRTILWGLWSVMQALRVTLRHLVTPAITVQYPSEKRQRPMRSLGKHALTIDLDTGGLKCTACDACARVCPTRCIALVGAGKGKDRRASEFIIDHNLCMYCNLCVEVCPFDAITMWTGTFELSGYQRSGLVYDLPDMLAKGFVPSPMTPEFPKAPVSASK